MDYLISVLNALWGLCLDLVYMILQLLLDTLVLLLSAIQWLCPVFPDLSPPQAFTIIAPYVAWIIPWNFILSLITVMAACMMFSIMTSWTLRWLKVIR